MSKIIYLPLEHIESRYTVHMDRDILKYLDESGKEYIRVYPDIPSPQTMKAGSFLDAEFTIRFKGRELQHSSLGDELMEKIKKDMQLIGRVELQPKFDGKQMIMVIQPI